MIEIAGLVLSGVSFAKDLYKEYTDYNTWPLSDLPVDRHWLALAINRGILEGTPEDYMWARPERIPTFELEESHKVVIFFNKDKKEAYRITEPGDRPNILVKKDMADQ